MLDYYKEKKTYHYDKWQLAIDSGNEIKATYNMREYLNYSEMVDLMIEREANNSD